MCASVTLTSSASASWVPVTVTVRAVAQAVRANVSAAGARLTFCGVAASAMVTGADGWVSRTSV